MVVVKVTTRETVKRILATQIATITNIAVTQTENRRLNARAASLSIFKGRVGQLMDGKTVFESESSAIADI